MGQSITFFVISVVGQKTKVVVLVVQNYQDMTIPSGCHVLIVCFLCFFYPKLLFSTGTIAVFPPAMASMLKCTNSLTLQTSLHCYLKKCCFLHVCTQFIPFQMGNHIDHLFNHIQKGRLIDLRG